MCSGRLAPGTPESGWCRTFSKQQEVFRAYCGLKTARVQRGGAGLDRKLTGLRYVQLMVAVLCCVILVMPAPVHTAEPAKAQLVVKGIEVSGNQEVDTSAILEIVENTVTGEPLDEEKVKKDMQAIASLGCFSDVKAEGKYVDGGIKVIFIVDENPRLVSAVINGNEEVEELVSDEDVVEILGLRQGSVIDARELSKNLQGFSETVWQKHGVYLRVISVNPGLEDGQFRLEVRPTRIGQVVLRGNQKTKDYVILREMKLGEGDILRRHQVQESLRRVMMLGYFDDVKSSLEPTGDPDTVDLAVELEERRTGSAAFGAGYSSSEGFVGYIEVADRNFLGRAKDVRVRWEFGKQKNTYDLGYYEPYLDDSGTSFGLRLYNRTFNRSDMSGRDYTENSVGGDVRVGRPIGEYSRLSLKYRAESSGITWEDTDESEHNRIRSLTLSADSDTTDHPFFPTEGYRGHVSVETAGRFLGGDVDFTKYQGGVSHYRQIGKGGQTLALRLNAGVATGDLPLQEKYRVGGADTVRGYAYGEMQGEKKVVLNGEYRFKIAEAVHGVLFVDAGNAWGTGEQIDFSDLKAGYGIGVRLDIPAIGGVIRIDYGIGENGGKTYFSIGQAF